MRPFPHLIGRGCRGGPAWRWGLAGVVLAGAAACMPDAQYEFAMQPASLVPGTERNITVLAAANWRDTGVTMRRGEEYEIVADGKWRAGATCNPTDASGIGEETPLCFRTIVLGPVPSANFSTLIGRIGAGGSPFIVGPKLTMTASGDGNLFLRMNDADGFLGDNTGQMSVTVRRAGSMVATRVAAPPEPPRLVTSNIAPMPAVPLAAPATAMLVNVDFGRYFALVIGNDAYQQLPKLKTATSDAAAVADLLQREYGFAVTMLTNATRGQIVDALDEFREKLRENDNLLIYYAGHGWLDEDAQRGYWLPVDANPNRRSAWLENTTITDTLRTLRAKHVMVVADSCYAGTLTRGAVVGVRSADYYERIAKKRARVALTSGGIEPVADSAGGRHSPFAQAFLQALRDNPAVLDGTELFSQMRRPVMLSANQTPEFSDVRSAGHDGGDFLFVKRK